MKRLFGTTEVRIVHPDARCRYNPNQMPFSTEFWVGTAIACVLAFIGVAVSIAVDARTKGEFRFVVGCFLTSAAIVVYGIGTWEMNTALASKYRLPIAMILFAGVAMGTVEAIRWAHGRDLRAAESGTLITLRDHVEVGVKPAAPITQVLSSEEVSRIATEIAKQLPQQPRPAGQGAYLNSDLRLLLYGKNELRFACKNPSKLSASKPKYWFALLDLTNPYSYPSKPDEANAFPIPAVVLHKDFVRPSEMMAGREVLNEVAKSHVKIGDIIFGVAWVTCENCIKSRAYYLYWKAGQGGWYAEANPSKLQLPRPVMNSFTEAQIGTYVDTLVPIGNRKPIPESI